MSPVVIIVGGPRQSGKTTTANFITGILRARYPDSKVAHWSTPHDEARQRPAPTDADYLVIDSDRYEEAAAAWDVLRRIGVRPLATQLEDEPST